MRSWSYCWLCTCIDIIAIISVVHVCYASSLPSLFSPPSLIRPDGTPCLLSQQVLGCVSSILLTDSEPKVQQAAVLVLTLLLKGQSGHAVQLLGDSLRDVYRLLKQVEGSERDELTLRQLWGS